MGIKNAIKRSLFNVVFGNAPTTIQGATDFKLLNSFIPYFYNFKGNIYDDAVIRTCIHTIANHASKLNAKHLYKGARKTGSDSFDRLLKRPNKHMGMSTFIYKVVSQLLVSNNAFVYVRRNAKLDVIGLYPVNFNQIKLVEKDSILYAQFLFNAGIQVTIPYSDLIHIRRHFIDNDMFGEDAVKPLKPTLDVLTTISQGIVNAIKSSAFIRGIIKFATLQPDKTLKKSVDEFIAQYLDINNNNGLAAIDNRAEFIPLNLEPKMADDKQTSLFRDNVYRYYNVSEKIIKSEYNESEFSAFYSSVLEPIAIQFSEEFSEKTFSDTELSFGNEIRFSADRMMFATLKDKKDMIKDLRGLGIVNANESREILEMSPISEEWAEEYIVSLNYVQAPKANKYQGVDNNDGQNDNADSTDDINPEGTPQPNDN